MQKIRFFIYNKDKLSVVIKKGEKVIEGKTFSLNQGDEILNYFLENGAKTQERKGKLSLLGGNCLYYSGFQPWGVVCSGTACVVFGSGAVNTHYKPGCYNI